MPLHPIGYASSRDDDKNINVADVDGKDLSIAYTLKDGKISLNKKLYFTEKQVDKGLQGYWKVNPVDTSLGVAQMFTIRLQDGKMKYESVAVRGYMLGNSFNFTNSGYYYGPYEDKYTLNLGGFDSKIYGADEWYFTIEDGTVVLYHYGHKCERSKDKKFPGKNGYF